MDSQSAYEGAETLLLDEGTITADADGVTAAAATVEDVPAAAADEARESSHEGAAPDDLADPGTPAGDAAPIEAEAPEEDAEGVPDQAAPLQGLSLRKPVLARSPAPGRKAWRLAQDPVLAAPKAVPEGSDAVADADETDSSAAAADPEAPGKGAAVSAEPHRGVEAAAETVVGIAGAGAFGGATAGGGSAGEASEAALRRLRQQPNRVLDDAQVESGISYVGHNARLRRLMRRLGQGDAISLGASPVTHIRRRPPSDMHTPLLFRPGSRSFYDLASCMHPIGCHTFWSLKHSGRAAAVICKAQCRLPYHDLSTHSHLDNIDIKAGDLAYVVMILTSPCRGGGR